MPKVDEKMNSLFAGHEKGRVDTLFPIRPRIQIPLDDIVETKTNQF